MAIVWDLNPDIQKGALKVIIRALQQELDGYDATYALKRDNLNLQCDIKNQIEKITKLKERNENAEKEKKALEEKIELLDYKLDKLCQALADANKRVEWYKKRKNRHADDYPDKDKFYSLGSTNPWHIRRYLNTIIEKPQCCGQFFIN